MQSDAGWKELNLGDVIELKRGYDLPKGRRSVGVIPIVSSSGISDFHSEAMVKGPGVVTGRYGTIGEVFYVDGDFWPLNTTLYVRDFKGSDPRFISYFLRTLDFQAYSDKGAVPGVNRNHLHTAKVRVPALPVQKAIAGVLGALDSKINLNRRVNQTIEGMAQAIFKSWFIDFDPVKAKIAAIEQGQDPLRAAMCVISGKIDAELDQMPSEQRDQLAATAALFPSEVEESELGVIPKGWRVVSFGEIAEQGKGSVNPLATPSKIFTHYSLPLFDKAQLPLQEPGGEIKSNKTPVPDNCILISKLNPRIPRIWLIGEAGKEAVCSTEFIVWTPRQSESESFVYCLASSPAFNDAMCQLVTGTSNSHQRVRPEQLAKIRAIAADDDVIPRFSIAVKPLLRNLLQRRENVRTLSVLRDTLLPKLLSGELAVGKLAEYMGTNGAT
ncbi:restriction endonuclease subunit S [Stenotrophomonas sp. CC22-02]|uniref:restriction endonuclease subunit S n=1 Tax=Stenotrophomonas sp. CC22-02 TaxID=1378087 RepID=UPI00106344D8|nr:restriction endonuclease subunit S [Stenotrophomonas sp. CC22-02]TDV30463.1 type I restriction enzyme S subunit [Stenotrophomonas sp. CC22-02]